ncbi:MAG: hypothetical protein Aurels2KO_22750 [Aureliella sp.]
MSDARNIKFILLDTAFSACISACLATLSTTSIAPTKYMLPHVAHLLLLAIPCYLANRFSFITIAILGGSILSAPSGLYDIAINRVGNYSAPGPTVGIMFIATFGMGAYVYFVVACARRTAVHLLKKRLGSHKD